MSRVCVFCFLLSVSHLVFHVQLSLTEPSRTKRTKRQVLTDDGDAIQQQIVQPQAAISLASSPRKSFVLVSEAKNPQTQRGSFEKQ